TRRLERNVEVLRARLAEQLGEINSKRSELALLKVERDQQLSIMHELETREAELRERIMGLEKTGTDLAQRLRMRDREFADLQAQMEQARERGEFANVPDIERLFTEL